MISAMIKTIYNSLIIQISQEVIIGLKINRYAF
jgi:hypothetical protein